MLNIYPKGKGFFIWKLFVPSGSTFVALDPEQIADQAEAAGLGHVLIKVANGVWRYNFLNGQDLCPAVVSALKARDIQVWGWHYVYGENPAMEAETACRRVNELGLDGYVLDAEAEWKQPGMALRARTLMDRIDLIGMNVPLALSSYRYPSLHRELPWDVFLPGVDFAMPQVYWMHAHNPAEQLIRTLDEYAKLAPGMGIVPTGAAFKEWGWIATPQEIYEFMFQADVEDCPAVNFWEWNNCQANLPAGWDEIADYPWPGPVIVPPEEPPADWEEAMEAIRSRVELLETQVAGQETKVYKLVEDVAALSERVAALEAGGEQPSDYEIVVATQGVPAFGQSGVNARGKPIVTVNVYMETGDPNLKWEAGDPIKIVPGLADTDGSFVGYQIHPAQGLDLHGYPALYVPQKKVV